MTVVAADAVEAEVLAKALFLAAARRAAEADAADFPPSSCTRTAARRSPEGSR